MRSALYKIDLENEEANYTIGQLVTHLKFVVDYSDYDKVEKHLRMREERVKEEARKEMEEAVVRRYGSKYEEVMRWKVKVDESVETFEEDVRVLRERYDQLRKQKSVVDDGVRVTGLLASKGYVELEKGGLRLGPVKMEVENGFEKRDLTEENVMLKKEVSKYREMVGELKKGADIEKLRLFKLEGLMKKKAEKDQEGEKSRLMEMEMLKKKAEKDLEVMEKRFKGLIEENVKLRRDDTAWREMNKDFKKLEEDANVRVSELEIQLGLEVGLRVAAEKSIEALESKIQDLVDDSLKLRKKIAELLDMNKDLTKQEEDLKVRVWKLENEVEIEESLRRTGEEDLESMEHKFQELERRISETEKNCSGRSKVAWRTNLTEAGSSCRRINMVDLTKRAHPGDSQGPVNGTEMYCSSQSPAIIVHIPSDSEDDTSISEAPLRFKRKRPRTQNLGIDDD